LRAAEIARDARCTVLGIGAARRCRNSSHRCRAGITGAVRRCR